MHSHTQDHELDPMLAELLPAVIIHYLHLWVLLYNQQCKTAALSEGQLNLVVREGKIPNCYTREQSPLIYHHKHKQACYLLCTYVSVYIDCGPSYVSHYSAVGLAIISPVYIQRRVL